MKTLRCNVCFMDTDLTCYYAANDQKMGQLSCISDSLKNSTSGKTDTRFYSYMASASHTRA